MNSEIPRVFRYAKAALNSAVYGSVLFGVLAALTVVLISRLALASPLAGLDTSSPRATYSTFERLGDRLADEYQAYRANKSEARAVAINSTAQQLRRLFDLSEIPPATRNEASGSAAVMLEDILNRLPVIDLAGIPGGDSSAEELPDQWTFPKTEIHIIRVKEGDRAGEFLFSPDTVARMPEFHSRVIDLPLVRDTPYANWRYEQAAWTGPLFPYDYLRILPEFWQQPLLDTPLWKLVFAVVFLLVPLIIIVLWTRFTLRLTRESEGVRRLFWRLTAPVLMMILVNFYTDLIGFQLNLSGMASDTENIASSILLDIALAWMIWLGAYFLVELIIASPAIPDDSYDAHLLRLLARVAAILGVAAVIVFGANDLGIPALGLVAGLGVGGFALALAAQSTVENLFGGVSIFADRPFRVNDFIHFGGNDGTVERIGPRSSRICGLDGTLMTVPNSDLAKMHVTNYSVRNKCLFRHVIGLRYETSPEQFEWLIEELREKIGAHPMVEEAPGFPRIRMTGFGASSIDVEVRAHVLTANFSEFLEIQEELILEIMRTVEAAGTGFAFPSQTTYLGRDTGLDQDAKQRVERELRLRKWGPEREPEEHQELVDAGGPDNDEDSER